MNRFGQSVSEKFKGLGMNLLNWWAQRGWCEIDCVTYERASAQFGGSVITHPEFIAAVSSLANMPLKYFGRFEGESLVGVVPTWGSFVAGDKRALKRAGQYNRLDIGNMEIILPFSPQVAAVPMHFKANNISSLHSEQIKNSYRKSETLSLLKSYSDNEFSKKFLYNRNREWRLLEAAGGAVNDISEFPLADVFNWYVNLFELRWKKKPKAFEYLYHQLDVLKDFLTGKVLFFDNKPIAIQLLFLVQSPEWISVEYLNGGIDTNFFQYSPGTVLTYLNTQSLSNYAQAQGKKLRYSFGLSDESYKALWCRKTPIYNT